MHANKLIWLKVTERHLVRWIATLLFPLSFDWCGLFIFICSLKICWQTVCSLQIHAESNSHQWFTGNVQSHRMPTAPLVSWPAVSHAPSRTAEMSPPVLAAVLVGFRALQVHHLARAKVSSTLHCAKSNFQKTKIMAFGPITSWEIDGETVSDYFFGLQNHCRWWLQPWN